MGHTCQLIMIVTGTFIYFKTIKLAIATTLVVNVRVPFSFTTWNKVVYTSGYVMTYIIKITEPNNLILILNLANKSYFLIKVNFCHLLAWFKNYDPLKVGVNSFWDTLYIKSVENSKSQNMPYPHDLLWARFVKMYQFCNTIYNLREIHPCLKTA